MKVNRSSRDCGAHTTVRLGGVWPCSFLFAAAVVLASVFVGAAQAQTAPTGFVADANIPVVAAGASSATTTYVLNRDESISYLQQGSITTAGCAAQDAMTFQAGTGAQQNLFYDATANLLYLMSPLANGDAGIVSETPNASGGCNPSAVVDLPGGANDSLTMASDAAESNLYVVNSHNHLNLDSLYALSTGLFASYPPTGATTVPAYTLDYGGVYGTLEVDASSHLVYIPETKSGVGGTQGSGFWVFDPAQKKIVRVVGYVDPVSSSQVNINCVGILIAGNGKIVVVNENPAAGMTLETTALYEFDTTKFSFFSETQAGTGSPVGVYIEPPSNALKAYGATASYSSISAADIDAAHGLVYVAAYNENSSSAIAQTGLLLSYNLATAAETVVNSTMAQPLTSTASVYTTWGQLSFDAYANEVLLSNSFSGSGTLAISTPLTSGSAQVNTIAASSFNPLGVAYNANSGYIYAPSVVTPGTPSDPTVYYFQPATVSPTATLSGVSFASTIENNTAGPLTATLANTSIVTLSNIGVSITGGQMSDFALGTGANACGATLGAGASCSIYVTFTPSGGGSFSATLQVTDNASPGTQTSALSGMGLAPVASLTPSPINFTPITTGSTSGSMQATLANTGNAALTIGSISIGGANPSDFAVASGANACGATLAAGASCTVYVTFTPASAASFTATLTVSDNATPGSQSVTLNGTGVSPPLLPAPTFNPATATTVGYSQTFTISSSVTGATIYYTTNGTAPNTSSTSCTTSCTVTANSSGSNETVEAFASYPPQYINSPVATATYTLATPSFTFTIAAVCSTANSCYPLQAGATTYGSTFTAEYPPVTVELSIAGANGYNTPFTVSSSIPSTTTNSQPSGSCVSSTGTKLSSCVYTPAGTTTTIYYAFYTSSGPIVDPTLRGTRVRLGALGLAGALLILVCGALARWRRMARRLMNLAGLAVLMVSLSVLVGGCNDPGNGNAATITVTPNNGSAAPQTVTVYLEYEGVT